MPKETIRGEGFNIEVSWGRDNDYLQIASVMKRPWNDKSPKNLAELLDTWSDEDKNMATGLFATITDRRTCNQLIALLKRARDTAFGKDE